MKIFSEQERRGLLLLMPLLLLVLLLYVVADRLQPEEFIPVEQDTEHSAEKPSESLSEFDPNTFTYEELRGSGLPVEVAVGIVRWRSYGKVYRLREDLAMVSGMTDSLYATLAPYVIIADSVAAKPKYLSNEPTYATSAPKHSLPEREKTTRTTAYANTPQPNSTSKSLSEPFADTLLVEINTADSATLVAINGIGPRSAAEIIRYRTLLGGYHSVEQLRELKSVTESNFERFLPKIWCDSFVISKIDINFARPFELERHPYISARALRRIVKQRQLKGGWTRTEEMIEDNILSAEEAERLAPYLRFRSLTDE